jgi:4-amino-4-deoxy-L-arabinose transferase-like glycosyltransferase
MITFLKKYTGKAKIFLYPVLIVVFAALLRLIKLGHFPVFADEAIYVRWAQIMRAEETLRFLPLSDGKQPLFMWLAIPFLKLISDPLYAGRMVSVLAGAGTVIGVYLISKKLFASEKAALLTALLAAVSPFLVFFDRLALVDSLLSFFAVWIFYFSVLNAEKLRLDLAMILGFLLGGAFLTKSPALFFALFLPLSILLVKLPKGNRLKIISKFILLTIVSLAIGYGFKNILRLGPNFSMLAARNLDYVYPYSHILNSPFSPLIPYLKDTFNYFWLLGPAALFGLFFVGLILTLPQKPKGLLYLLAWIVFPLIAITEYGKVFTARYILFIVPFVLIIAGTAFLPVKDLIKKAVMVLLLLFLVQSGNFVYLLLSDFEKTSLPRSERSGYLEEWTAGYGIREVADFLKTEQKDNPNEKIVVGTEGYFGTLPDGLQIFLNDTPQITVIGIGLGIDRLPKQLIESTNNGNKTYLVINNSRLQANPDNIGLTLVAGYPKAVNPDGDRETLLLFEVNRVSSKEVK